VHVIRGPNGGVVDVQGRPLRAPAIPRVAVGLRWGVSPVRARGARRRRPRGNRGRLKIIIRRSKTDQEGRDADLFRDHARGIAVSRRCGPGRAPPHTCDRRVCLAPNLPHGYRQTSILLPSRVELIINTTSAGTSSGRGYDSASTIVGGGRPRCSQSIGYAEAFPSSGKPAS
jgi:hypothetical protein